MLKNWKLYVRALIALLLGGLFGFIVAKVVADQLFGDINASMVIFYLLFFIAATCTLYWVLKQISDYRVDQVKVRTVAFIGAALLTITMIRWVSDPTTPAMYQQIAEQLYYGMCIVAGALTVRRVTRL